MDIYRKEVQGVQEKLCLFTANYIQYSSCRNAIHTHKKSQSTVTPIGRPFFLYNQWQPGAGEVVKLLKFLLKTHFFLDTQ